MTHNGGGGGRKEVIWPDLLSPLHSYILPPNTFKSSKTITKELKAQNTTLAILQPHFDQRG